MAVGLTLNCVLAQHFQSRYSNTDYIEAWLSMVEGRVAQVSLTVVDWVWSIVATKQRSKQIRTPKARDSLMLFRPHVLTNLLPCSFQLHCVDFATSKRSVVHKQVENARRFALNQFTAYSVNHNYSASLKVSLKLTYQLPD